jgi:hypothetical protein
MDSEPRVARVADPPYAEDWEQARFLVRVIGMMMVGIRIADALLDIPVVGMSVIVVMEFVCHGVFGGM